MSVTQLFKPVKEIDTSLPSPIGPLAVKVASSRIEGANKRVRDTMISEGKAGQRGHYEKYTAKEKATVANYTILHGSSAEVRHFIKDYPRLKRTAVNDWRNALMWTKQCNQIQGIGEPHVHQDIKAVVEFEDVPSQLIINWDQTGINYMYVPVSQWTMEGKGTKRVDVIGLWVIPYHFNNFLG